MKSRLFVTGFCTAALLFSCSPLTLVNVTSPTNHYEKVGNLQYGDHPQQTLDLYVPKQNIEHKESFNTLVVFFHGGGWDSGNKNKYKFIASSLTSHGYTVVIPNYRLYPEVKFPTFVNDAMHSTLWLLNNKDQHIPHIKQIYFMGHSAGAHIASLIVFDDRYYDKINDSKISIAGFIGIAGPYNFLPLQSIKMKNIFPENLRYASQPINYVNGDEVPTLLLHGMKDKTVIVENSMTMFDEIKKKNGMVALKLYENINHTKILIPFVNILDNYASTTQDIIEFMQSHEKQ